MIDYCSRRTPFDPPIIKSFIGSLCSVSSAYVRREEKKKRLIAQHGVWRNVNHFRSQRSMFNLSARLLLHAQLSFARVICRQQEFSDHRRPSRDPPPASMHAQTIDDEIPDPMMRQQHRRPFVIYRFGVVRSLAHICAVCAVLKLKRQSSRTAGMLRDVQLILMASHRETLSINSHIYAASNQSVKKHEATAANQFSSSVS